jgi:hypothetical protein
MSNEMEMSSILGAITIMSRDQVELLLKTCQDVLKRRMPVDGARSPLLRSVDQPLDLELTVKAFCGKYSCTCSYDAQNLNDRAICEKDYSGIRQDQLFISCERWREDNLTSDEIRREVLEFLKSQKVKPNGTTTLLNHRETLYVGNSDSYYCLLTCSRHEAAALTQQRIAEHRPEWYCNFNRTRIRKKMDKDDVSED